LHVPSSKKTVDWQGHLIAVVVHQLQAVQMIPLQLPHLSAPRLVRIAQLFTKTRGDRQRSLRFAGRVEPRKRSVERLFQQDIGMTFGKWRQQLRLMQAMRLLAQGEKVTFAALESGYSTPSAFISVFRKALGITPTSYFK